MPISSYRGITLEVISWFPQADGSISVAQGSGSVFDKYGHMLLAEHVLVQGAALASSVFVRLEDGAIVPIDTGTIHLNVPAAQFTTGSAARGSDFAVLSLPQQYQPYVWEHGWYDLDPGFTAGQVVVAGHHGTPTLSGVPYVQYSGTYQDSFENTALVFGVSSPDGFGGVSGGSVIQTGTNDLAGVVSGGGSTTIVAADVSAATVEKTNSWVAADNLHLSAAVEIDRLVTQTYRFVGLEPTAGEKAYWVQQALPSTSSGGLLGGLTAEGLKSIALGVGKVEVALEMGIVFDREAYLDPAGFGYWNGRHDAGMSLEAIGREFLGSPEFHQKYGNPDPGTLTDILAENVVGYTLPSGPERDYWVARVAENAAGVVAQLATSTVAYDHWVSINPVDEHYIGVIGVAAAVDHPVA